MAKFEWSGNLCGECGKPIPWCNAEALVRFYEKESEKHLAAIRAAEDAAYEMAHEISDAIRALKSRKENA